MKTYTYDLFTLCKPFLERQETIYPEEVPYTFIKTNMKRWAEDDVDEEPLVSIIILTKDNLEYLRACLASIERFTTDIPVEIIIVSNCVKKKTQDYLDSSGYKIIYRDDEFNFARYNNKGASIARGKYLVFLNDDTVVTPNWLKYPVEILEEDEEIGVCGVKVLDYKGQLSHMGIAINQPGDFFSSHPFAGYNPDIPFANEYRFVKAVSGVCLITSQEVFNSVGGFMTNYRGGYFEDLDFCLRVESTTDKKVLYVPDSVIFHAGSISFSRLQNKMQIFHEAERAFREQWSSLEENNSYRFTRPRYLYKKSKDRLIIRNAHMFTAGGGEQLVLNLIRTFRDDFHIELQVHKVSRDLFERLESLLNADLYGIDIENINPDRSCKVFINTEHGSAYGGQPSYISLYYTMFPVIKEQLDFLAFYDAFVGISNFSCSHIKDRWHRHPHLIYPVVIG